MNIQVINNRAINLDKVSTVKVDNIRERIYFNMNFSTQNSNGVFIQDYVYVKLNINTFNEITKLLNDNKNFIMYDKNKWVNLKQVSSMKYDDAANRIIMNLSNPHTYEFPHGSKVLAEFIYMEDVTQEDFNNIITTANSL